MAPSLGGMFTHPVNVRYLEVDGQGVVFNMWYLAYADDAMTGFLAHRGLPYDQLIAAGLDTQVVSTQLTWTSGVGWGDEVAVAVSVAAWGTTSFTLDFEVRRAGTPTCWVRTVYVVVATDGSGKRPVPADLRAALGEPAPLLPER